MELTKTERLANLYSYYGSLLTKSQQKYCESYYYDDLGLTEIADNFQVSRQAVYDNIKKTAKLLEKFEAKLHFYSDLTKIDQLAEEAEKSDDLDAIKVQLAKIQKIVRGD